MGKSYRRDKDSLDRALEPRNKRLKQELWRQIDEELDQDLEMEASDGSNQWADLPGPDRDDGK
ncbi:MAG TPA: hypothetical protein VIY48_05200 [Candidatus Paceibacterota bacterium]